jgi:hypothetical protein
LRLGLKLRQTKAECVAGFISNTMPGFCNSLGLWCFAVDMQEASGNAGRDTGDAGIFVGGWPQEARAVFI